MSSIPIPPESDRPSGPVRPILVLLTSHWISLIGVALILTALCTWIFLLPLQLRGETDNPYLGLLAFLIVPMVLFAGLALVPVGAWIARKRVRRKLKGVLDKKTAWSRFAVTFAVATVINLGVGTQVTFSAVKHMETATFCGSCHVMTPEQRTHADSVHAQTKCAECHVGDGASGWFASKWNGARQFFENLSESFPRPIPSALATDRLVPAKQTCEECHWRGKPGNIVMRVIDSFSEDEANSLSQTVLTMHVGGTVLGGIHGRHLDPNITIRFRAKDPERQDIVWVEAHDAKTGVTRTYTKAGSTSEPAEGQTTFTMQCVDCHNRIGHALQLPGRALDAALAGGRLPTTLPFLKKIAMELFKTEYASQTEASEKIPAVLLERYAKEQPDVFAKRERDIAAAGAVLVDIHNRNVYPDLKVKWGAYPSNIGHTDSLGCFRCHDGDHRTKDDKLIPNNCFTCHFTSALDEPSPEVLQTIGLEKVLEKIRKK